jgi:selenocysteine lyase/cysteine desulfurase
LGIQNIADHNQKLVKLLLNELNAINGVEIITPSTRGSIIAFKIEGKKTQEVGQRLRTLERPVEMSIRQGMIRIALHFYNTESDIDHLVENLKNMLNEI